MTAMTGRRRKAVQTQNRKLQIVENGEALSLTAAEMMVSLALKKLKTKESFAVALSGGSTPKNMFGILANDAVLRGRMPWDRVHFFWGDERHVAPDHSDSNYRMTNETMLSRVPVPSENIHRIQAENPDAGKAAEDYEQELRRFFKLETEQLPPFDCVFLGMGPDGHTASLFPGTQALHERERLVVSNWVAKFQSHRITMTTPVLNNADTVIFLVSGEEKAEPLRVVLEGQMQTDRFPAQLIEPTHGKLLWLVDQAAAGQLGK
jgi:6-phosphogluconolactonase